MKLHQRLLLIVGAIIALVVLFAQFSGPAPIRSIVREYGFITRGGWTINSSNLWKARLEPDEVERLREALVSDGWTRAQILNDYDNPFTAEYDLPPQTGDTLCHKKLIEEDYLCHILIKPDGRAWLLAFSSN
jgi:hypothetical protein